MAASRGRHFRTATPRLSLRSMGMMGRVPARAPHTERPRRPVNAESLLSRSLEQLLELLAVTATGGEAGAVVENYDVITLKERLQLTDLVDAHDG